MVEKRTRSRQDFHEPTQAAKRGTGFVRGDEAAHPDDTPDIGFEESEDEFIEEQIVQAGETMDDEDDEKRPEQTQVWMPEVAPVGEDEELVVDNSYYKCLHRLNTDWPSMSFDILADAGGVGRARFPHTLYLMRGTSGPAGGGRHGHKLEALKLSELHKTKYDDGAPMDEDESDEDVDGDPVVQNVSWRVPASVNRVRVMPQKPGGPLRHVVACWLSNGRVQVYDGTTHVSAMDRPPAQPLVQPHALLTSKNQHATEGYALDWSLCANALGVFASGDCRGGLTVWQPNEGSGWRSMMSLKGHNRSVEDIQWSPAEAPVLATASVDKSIAIYDMRTGSVPVLRVANAHDADVNVISWNRDKDTSNLLLSGGDDGLVKVWDLRSLAQSRSNNTGFTPAQTYGYHRGAITSVQWSPHDASMFVASGEDNQCTIWDLSAETDTEVATQGASLGALQVPQQLMFDHRGQNEIKEVHWHPQIPNMLVSTSREGFHIFMPDNL